MKNIKKIQTYGSAVPTNIWLVFLDKGDVESDLTGFAVVDLDKTGAVTRIRQCESDIEHEPVIVRNNRLRKLCKKRGAEAIHAPGDYVPIVRKGFVAVADYKDSGTHYYLCPKSVYDILPSSYHMTREEEVTKKMGRTPENFRMRPFEKK